jgi:ribosomal-protein-alanine N-acetyltransferase
MLTKDLDFVTLIETKGNEYYTSRDDMMKLLRKRSVVAMVAIEGENEDNGEIVGFVIYELMNRRIQLHNLVVSQKHRKKGIGSILIDKLKEKLSKRNKISAEVRETNLQVQMFLKSKDFNAVEMLRNYFLDTGEDAFVMSYVLK